MTASPDPTPVERAAKARRRWGDSTIVKLAALALLVLLLLIPVSSVTDLIRERMGRQAEVAAEIAGSWGGAQTLSGPILAVPYSVTVEHVTVHERGDDPDPEERTVRRTEETYTRVLYALPSNLSWQAEIEPEIRYRGLFEVVVYEARLTVSGVFERPSIEGPAERLEVHWDRAALLLGVPDVRGLQKRARLRWSDREIDFLPGTGGGELLASGIHAPLGDWGDGPPGEAVPFGFELDLRGSGDLFFVPVGEETRVEMSSPWPSPGFGGAFLPREREIRPEGFTASWSVPHFARDYGQVWSDEQRAAGRLAASAFGVSLVLPADAYQQTERSVKYAVLFILLTFGTFFLLELLSPERLHAVQYLLVGFALCVFYVLLLALGEHLGFNLAYLLAATATVGLIGGYSWSILASGRRAAVVLGALAALYGLLYLLLKLEDYALLFGAVGLFAALALAMRLTRHLDWYSLSFRSRERGASA